MAHCGSHTIFGQRALEVIRWREVEHDSRSGPSLVGHPMWCLLRAGGPAEASSCAGQAELPRRPCKSLCWKWQTGEKFHRPADGQETLTTNCWHQQNRSSHPNLSLSVGLIPEVGPSRVPEKQTAQPTGSNVKKLFRSFWPFLGKLTKSSG